MTSAAVSAFKALNADVTEPAGAEHDRSRAGAQDVGGLSCGVVGGQPCVGVCGDIARLQGGVEL